MVEGHGPPPSLVGCLVRALPDDSLTVALMNGGRQFNGWGMDRHLAAATFDAINQNTVATGQWKKGKAPSLPPWPRPSKPKKKKKLSVAELYAKLTKT